MSQPVLNIDTVDFENGLIENDVLLKRLSKLIDSDPYCIINTSGSTGTPKGVILNHKSFVDFTEWSIDTFKFSDDEIIGSKVMEPFGGSVFVVEETQGIKLHAI